MKNRQYARSASGGFKLMLAGLIALTILSMQEVALAQSADNPSIASSAVREKIEQGRSELQEFNYSAASGILTQVIQSEQTPPEWLAIAFFYRGIANRMTGQNAAAVADFINALWLDTLPETIEAQAYFHRAHAREAMGEIDEALADLDLAAKIEPDEPRIVEARNQMLGIADPETTASIANESNADEAVRNAVNGPANNEVLAGNIPATPQTIPSAPARQVSLQPESQPAGIRIQLGALASQDIANAEWQRISQQHQDILGNLTPTFQLIMRDGKSMVRLQAGPAASLPAARNLCALLKGRGQDCIAVGR